MEFLSDIELYICSNFSEEEKILEINEDEFHHSVKVMRNKTGDKIFATNGKGKIFEGIITEIGKENLTAKIVQSFDFENELENFTICIPNLKNPERFKFALEKSIELGFTNFIIFTSERTISKNINLKRIEKISLAAMKQSLHSYFPKINLAKAVSELANPNHNIVLFDQSSTLVLSDYKFNKGSKYFLIFGPEGSFSESEIKILKPNLSFNLGNYRLRTETAIVKCASIISAVIKND